MKKEIKKLKIESLMFFVATIVFATAVILKGQTHFILTSGIFALMTCSNVLEIALIKAKK